MNPALRCSLIYPEFVVLNASFCDRSWNLSFLLSALSTLAFCNIFFCTVALNDFVHSYRRQLNFYSIHVAKNSDHRNSESNKVRIFQVTKRWDTPITQKTACHIKWIFFLYVCWTWRQHLKRGPCSLDLRVYQENLMSTFMLFFQSEVDFSAFSPGKEAHEPIT